MTTAETADARYRVATAADVSLPRSARTIATTARAGGWNGRITIVDPHDVLIRLTRPPHAVGLTFNDGSFKTGWLIVNKSLPIAVGYRQALALIKQPGTLPYADGMLELGVSA